MRTNYKLCQLTILALTGVLNQFAHAQPAQKPAVGLVKMNAVPFDLRQVRLLDGPFKLAQDVDKKYLLSLDPDRLLHVFRLNAGLPSAAEPLGGWEAPKIELRGHFVGHYLS